MSASLLFTGKEVETGMVREESLTATIPLSVKDR